MVEGGGGVGKGEVGGGGGRGRGKFLYPDSNLFVVSGFNQIVWIRSNRPDPDPIPNPDPTPEMS